MIAVPSIIQRAPALCLLFGTKVDHGDIRVPISSTSKLNGAANIFGNRLYGYLKSIPRCDLFTGAKLHHTPVKPPLTAAKIKWLIKQAAPVGQILASGGKLKKCGFIFVQAKFDHCKIGAPIFFTPVLSCGFIICGWLCKGSGAKQKQANNRCVAAHKNLPKLESVPSRLTQAVRDSKRRQKAVEVMVAA